MNVVLTDFKSPQNWAFLSTLRMNSSLDWRVWSMHSNHLHGNLFLNLLRFSLYFLFPLLVLLRRRSVKTIIAWQQFYGLNFAFWLRLFGLKKKQELIIMTFIFKPKDGAIGKIYNKYMSYIVNSIYIDKFVCFSKRECDFYSGFFHTDRKRFQYIPLGIENINDKIISKIKTKSFVFSTGRSNRDYDFLINSLKNEDYEVHIACDILNRNNYLGMIEINENCFGDAMLKEMAESKCVVVTLRDTNISSGQLVILQAMQMGKPVVVTRSAGIEEYVEDGVNGILIDNNKEELLSALRKIYTDEFYYDQLSQNSRNMFKNKYTIECMANNISRIISEIEN